MKTLFMIFEKGFVKNLTAEFKQFTKKNGILIILVAYIISVFNCFYFYFIVIVLIFFNYKIYKICLLLTENRLKS